MTNSLWKKKYSKRIEKYYEDKCNKCTVWYLPEIFISESLTVSPTCAFPYNNGSRTSFFIGSKTFVYI